MKKLLLAIALAAAISFLSPPLAGVFSSKARSNALPRFHYGALHCAVNVNAWLQLHGKRGTGSASSKSFLRFRRVASPRFGDVRFNRRDGGGGHVAIYIGKGMCLNPRQNKGWRKVPCNRIWRGRAAIFVRPQ